MVKKIVVSTDNINKIKEIQDIMADLPLQILSKSQLGLADFHIEEDGASLEENSLKKARALAERTDYMVMADDSGLFVDLLEGQPGVHSSRYGGEEGNDEKNKARLLEELAPYSGQERRASFKTVISLIDQKKNSYIFKGFCSGIIKEEAQGQGGFGYDPLFQPDGYDKTFAQLEEGIKNRISHRYQALNQLKEFLHQLCLGEDNEDISDQ